jgi:bifunctional DNA-binding transcriptional regulator/antitoxin component of YhaV-PrlF toxin-antitoxin module
MAVTAQVSKITAKGQTTVPRLVRDLLHVGASDYLVWEQRGDAIVVRPGTIQPTDGFDELAAQTERRFKRERVTAQDINDAVTGARRKRKSK